MFSPCSKNLPGTSLGVPRADLRPASTGEHTADGRGGPWESMTRLLGDPRFVNTQPPYFCGSFFNQWIGLRENLQETMGFYH